MTCFFLDVVCYFRLNRFLLRIFYVPGCLLFFLFQDVAQWAGISAMPTFKAYHNGSEVDELVGASEPNLRKLIENLAGRE